jgi:hypothetical protein
MRTTNGKGQISQIKVPPTLRDIHQNRDCYDPSVVSIGPYHHGKTKALEEMEKLKETYALDFVKDCKKLIAEIDSEVEAMLSIAKKLLSRRRRRKLSGLLLTLMCSNYEKSICSLSERIGMPLSKGYNDRWVLS